MNLRRKTYTSKWNLLRPNNLTLADCNSINQIACRHVLVKTWQFWCIDEIWLSRHDKNYTLYSVALNRNTCWMFLYCNLEHFRGFIECIRVPTPLKNTTAFLSRPPLNQHLNCPSLPFRQPRFYILVLNFASLNS